MRELLIEDVAVRFGKVHALDGVTLELRAGEAVLVAGPNGAGKSTLMRVILGLIRPDRGQLRADGEPQAVDTDFKSRVGYLPEAVAFAPNLSGSQVLGFFAAARGVKRSRIAEVLAMVGLEAAAGRRVRGYSRGMRQRLGLGVAILHEPELLILDEPTGGLDQEGLSVLWRVLADWRAKGRIALISTHDFALMERRVDRMCILKQGRVRALDTPATLRHGTDLPVQVGFKLNTAHADIDTLVERLRTVANRMHQPNGELLVDVEPSQLLRLVEISTAWPGVVQSLRVQEPGLDLVYERLLEEEA